MNSSAAAVHRRDYPTESESDLYADVAGGVADFKINNSRITGCALDKISKHSKRKSNPKKSHRIIKDDKK